jgi:GR25 family glycosyltransferase involved in LPS biosynthesis
MVDPHARKPPSIAAPAGSHLGTAKLQVRCISVAGSPRREALAAQLNELGVPWSFFDARTTPPADIPCDEALTRRVWGQPLTRGELGCYASHYELWKSVAADDGPAVLLVLEADVWLDPTFFAHDEQLVEPRSVSATFCCSR